MKSLKYLLGLCLLAFIMSSCQSKEERVIKSLESLCMQVEQRADQFTEKDWENVITKFEKIHSDALDCDFTEEQLKELIDNCVWQVRRSSSGSYCRKTAPGGPDGPSYPCLPLQCPWSR